MKNQKSQFPSLTHQPSEEEVIAVKRAFSSLLLACKNITIYPPGHATTLDSINLFHSQLTDFLKKYGALHLEIERDRITYKDEAVSKGLPEEGSLHFALFQVGIRWLKFLPEIEPEEIQGILNIFVKHSKISSDSDGDIVTAFWEAQFPHLEYEVAEFSWVEEREEAKDISSLIQGKTPGLASGEYRDQPDSMEILALDPSALMLTDKEKQILKDMIRREEGEDLTSFLDILLDSLLQHRDQENFKVISEVLSDEFKGSLIRKDFIDSFRILHGLRYVLDSCRTETPWAGQFLEKFLLNLSLESQAPLEEIWSSLGMEDAGILGQIFKFFSPQAIPLFVTFLPRTQSTAVRQVLVDSILLLASADMGPLKVILEKPDEGIMENLIPVLVRLEGEQAMDNLVDMALHSSAQVRQEAVKGIIRRDPARLKDLFSSIDSMEKEVRMLILEQLGRSRDTWVEDHLLDYLQKLPFNKKNTDYLEACFKTLGKCGSAHSVPYLRATLFKGGFFPTTRNTVFRKGAAAALTLLTLPEAEAVLEKARRSFNLGLRMIFRKT